MTSKLENVVLCYSASDCERTSNPHLWFHMVWNARYPIYKTVKTVFLFDALLKSDWFVDKDHFPCYLMWRQNLKNWCGVVPLLTMNEYPTLTYDFIWPKMLITLSTKLWKPFFSTMFYWKVIGWWIRVISRDIWFDVKTWKILTLLLCFWLWIDI